MKSFIDSYLKKQQQYHGHEKTTKIILCGSYVAESREEILLQYMIMRKRNEMILAMAIFGTLGIFIKTSNFRHQKLQCGDQLLQ